MIFVTVGEQLPFDRLVRAMDQWAGQTGQEVIAQVGRSAHKSAYLQASAFLDQEAFLRYLSTCSLVVAHAGMGTIITAVENGKPIIVMPRQASLGEHRNDHQLATARRFAALHYVRVVHDPAELQEAIEDVLFHLGDQHGEQKKIEPSQDLIRAIHDFIMADPQKN